MLCPGPALAVKERWRYCRYVGEGGSGVLSLGWYHTGTNSKEARKAENKNIYIIFFREKQSILVQVVA